MAGWPKKMFPTKEVSEMKKKLIGIKYRLSRVDLGYLKFFVWMKIFYKISMTGTNLVEEFSMTD